MMQVGVALLGERLARRGRASGPLAQQLDVGDHAGDHATMTGLRAREAPTVVGEGLGDPPLPRQEDGEIVVAFRVLRVDAEGRLEGPNGFGHATEPPVDDPEIRVALQVLGIEFKGVLKLRRRLRELPLTDQGYAQVVVGLHVVRIDRQGLPVVLDGLVYLSDLFVENPKIVVGLDVKGIQLDRLLVRRKGLSVLALFLVEEAHIEVVAILPLHHRSKGARWSGLLRPRGERINLYGRGGVRLLPDPRRPAIRRTDLRWIGHALFGDRRGSTGLTAGGTRCAVRPCSPRAADGDDDEAAAPAGSELDGNSTGLCPEPVEGLTAGGAVG